MSAPTTSSRSAPSRAPYALATVVATVGTVVAVVWCATALVDQVQRPHNFVRAPVPEAVSVALTRTGPHLVYVEVPRGDAVPDLVDNLRVTDPAGAPVDLDEHDVGLQYDAPDGRLATAVASFDAERTGTYVVLLDGAPEVPDGTRLAVGDDLAPSLLRAVLLPSLAGLLSLGAAVALAVATWSRRRSAAGHRPTPRPTTRPTHGEMS